MDIEVFTDGACKGNPGKGGWAFILRAKEEIEGFGCNSSTTNNRMELQAVIAGLEAALSHAKADDSVHLYSDSIYVIKGLMEWMGDWIKRGWRTSAGKAVLNQDLWIILNDLRGRLGKRLICHHLLGHTGHVENERCDKLACKAAVDQISSTGD